MKPCPCRGCTQAYKQALEDVLLGLREITGEERSWGGISVDLDEVRKVVEELQ